MLRRFTTVLSVVGVGLVGASARADTIHIQSTSDTTDAGLVEGLLKPEYKAAQPGDTLDYVGTSTGKAIDNSKNGGVDVVITHAPSKEAAYVKGGYSVESSGRAIFYSDYVIIGPKSDPAGVLSGAPHDAAAAFEKIAQAGAAGKATFVSRGDKSGTETQEHVIWGLTSSTIVPTKEAFDSGGDAKQREPSGDDHDGYPKWYVLSNKNQGANVQFTAACAKETAPNGNCYTMVDRGTYDNLAASGTIPNLAVLADKNTPDARGGENLLINPFSVYAVNPAKVPASAPPNVAAAKRFIAFLTGPKFQADVDVWPSAANPRFRADAYPKVDVTPPTVGLIGQAVPLDLTLSSRLPGAGVLAGISVQLQQSTDGVTFVDAGAPQTTDGAGKTSFAPVLAASTTYRVVTSDFGQPLSQLATGYVSGLTSSTQTIAAVVAAPRQPAGTGPAPGVGTTTPATDKTPPSVTKVKLSATKLSFSVSEKAAVSVKISKRVKKGKRTSYKKVKALSYKAGTTSRSFKRLSAGTYHVTLKATDALGNVKSRTVTLTVKAKKTR